MLAFFPLPPCGGGSGWGDGAARCLPARTSKMDFDLSDEQRLLKDAVTSLIEKEYTFEQRKAYAKEPLGYSEARWAQYAELALLRLPFAEELGGIGGTPVETMIVMEAFGRGLVIET